MSNGTIIDTEWQHLKTTSLLFDYFSKYFKLKNGGCVILILVKLSVLSVSYAFSDLEFEYKEGNYKLRNTPFQMQTTLVFVVNTSQNQENLKF